MAQQPPDTQVADFVGVLFTDVNRPREVGLEPGPGGSFRLVGSVSGSIMAGRRVRRELSVETAARLVGELRGSPLSPGEPGRRPFERILATSEALHRSGDGVHKEETTVLEADAQRLGIPIGTLAWVPVSELRTLVQNGQLSRPVAELITVAEHARSSNVSAHLVNGIDVTQDVSRFLGNEQAPASEEESVIVAGRYAENLSTAASGEPIIEAVAVLLRTEDGKAVVVKADPSAKFDHNAFDAVGGMLGENILSVHGLLAHIEAKLGIALAGKQLAAAVIDEVERHDGRMMRHRWYLGHAISNQDLAEIRAHIATRLAQAARSVAEDPTADEIERGALSTEEGLTAAAARRVGVVAALTCSLGELGELVEPPAVVPAAHRHPDLPDKLPPKLPALVLSRYVAAWVRATTQHLGSGVVRLVTGWTDRRHGSVVPWRLPRSNAWTRALAQRALYTSLIPEGARRESHQELIANYPKGRLPVGLVGQWRPPNAPLVQREGVDGSSVSRPTR